jgi:hypothetical protein
MKYSGLRNELINSVKMAFSSKCLRNKSWKPECVLSFNMGWRILVFYPEPEARDKFTNIRQPMLKLKTHSGFHDLFRF